MTQTGMAVAVLVFAFPYVTRADLSGTVLLQANTPLNLETGTTVSTGGDILWTGSSIAPQAGAKAYGFGAWGVTNFNGFAESFWATYTSAASSAAIPSTKLVPGDAFIVVTTGGHLAKVFVSANSGGLISLLFTTYGVSAAAGVPVISQILNNSSLIPPLFPNYGIAPSSIFVVRGSSLSDPGTPVLQSSAAPGIPLTLNGASITVVVNGVTTHPALYYTSPAQLAAVLPAATPVGTGAITVTYRGSTSAPAPIQVVPSALGINVYGVNTGVATDAVSGVLLTLNSSGSPGQTITLWTTGLGADPADSDTTYTLKPHRVNTPLQIYIGGLLAKILYQGASPYPGVNQINLTIPPGTPTGCWVSLVAATGILVSNAVTLPIHNGGGSCVDVVTGLNGNQVSPTHGLKAGLVALIQSSAPLSNGTRSITNVTDAAFETYSGLYNPGKSLSPGGCTVGPITPAPIPLVTGLDAGTITLTGPNDLSITLGPQFGIKGAFFSSLTASAIPSSGGTFTFNGSGGADVGPFTATVTLSNPLLIMTSQFSTSVDRTQGMPVAWTGGNPGTYVYITGVSTSTPLGVQAGFTCLAAIDAQQFTVPAYVLLGLPVGVGGTGLQNNVYSTLTATGLDTGLAVGNVNYSAGTITYK